MHKPRRLVTCTVKFYIVSPIIVGFLEWNLTSCHPWILSMELRVTLVAPVILGAGSWMFGKFVDP